MEARQLRYTPMILYYWINYIRFNPRLAATTEEHTSLFGYVQRYRFTAVKMLFKLFVLRIYYEVVGVLSGLRP